MDVFYALGEPTRRSILEILAQDGQQTATEIYERFEVSSAAISQHLKVLREARLVTMQKRAQQRIYELNPATVREIEDWVKQMASTYEQRFAKLDLVLEDEKAKLKGKKQS